MFQVSERWGSARPAAWAPAGPSWGIRALRLGLVRSHGADASWLGRVMNVAGL